MKRYTLYTMVGFMWINLGMNGMLNNSVQSGYPVYSILCHSESRSFGTKNLKQLQDEIYSIISAMDIAPEKQIEKQVDAARLFEQYI